MPEGVELTPQGSDLAVEESAVVAWEPRQDLVGVLDVTVTRLEQTTFAESFEGWQLDETTRKSTPYFVHATIKNVGESDVGGRDVPLVRRRRDRHPDPGVRPSRPSSSRAPATECSPRPSVPSGTKDICLVYLVPDGGELTAVSFRPSQDFDPITWTGPIKNAEARS